LRFKRPIRNATRKIRAYHIMNTISCPPLYPPNSSASGSLQISQSSRTTLNTRANAEISLVTADGDKVTLSASSALQTTHIIYDYLGRMEGQAPAAHAEKLQLSSTSEFAVTVEGELDQGELADINELLDAIETTAAGVFSGKPGGLLKSFAGLRELDSIASFDAALSYSREASAERATSITSASEAPAGDATDTAPANNSSEPRNTRPFLKKLAQLARRLEDEKGLDKLPRRFTQLFEKLAHNLTLDEHEQSLTDRVAAEHSKHRSGLEHPSTTRHQ
jgi:hypothetical protein